MQLFEDFELVNVNVCVTAYVRENNGSSKSIDVMISKIFFFFSDVRLPN